VNDLTDVPGILVGHRQRIGRGWQTGTTVVLAPAGAVAGVDVRGGGPGTHETDLLRPENLVQQVHGICLTGGSAYGLSAASGVMTFLEERSIGFPVGPEGVDVVPIVPAAVIYDLGRGGAFRNRPDADFGYRAARAARARPSGMGTIGAGPVSGVTIACANVATCAAVDENQTLTLSCPAGRKILSINFASYGTPNGSCGGYTIGTCHAANSASIVGAACIGQNSCTVNATNGVFGDPCVGTLKRLWVQASCS